MSEQDRIAWEWVKRIESVKRFSPEYFDLCKQAQAWLDSVGRKALYATYDD